MTEHISEDLPQLLTGEADRQQVLTSAAHLRTCPDCQHELVAAVVAHASLLSAARFAPEITSALPGGLLPDPTGTAAPQPTRADRPAPEQERYDATGVDLPDLSAVFADVRREVARPRRRPTSTRVRSLLAAGAAAVVVGGGIGGYLAASGGSGSGGRTVHLAAFDQGRSDATATIARGDRVTIDATGLPRLTGKRYEVWLTDGARSQMQPVGWLAPDGKAAMVVPADLLKRFSDIEVSVQDITSPNYTYSGTSVLRGGYS
jgi:hypothetical protein